MAARREPFFGARMQVPTASVMDASKHLVSAVVIGREADGTLYVAGTNGAADSVDLCAAAIRYLLNPTSDMSSLAALEPKAVA